MLTTYEKELRNPKDSSVKSWVKKIIVTANTDAATKELLATIKRIQKADASGYKDYETKRMLQLLYADPGQLRDTRVRKQLTGEE